MFWLATGVAIATSAPPRPQPGPPAEVRIVKLTDGYQLTVNALPFFVRGAGLEFGDISRLSKSGANALRTWRVDNGRQSGQAVLDEAMSHGLYVALGVEVARERHGFDYGDAKAVAKQFRRIRSEVRRYRRHPALLFWVMGNELNLESRDPRVWNAVNQLAEMVHREDPHHPVMTTVAGLDPAVIGEIRRRAPALDALGIQLYGEIDRFPALLARSGWTGPYLVTEWGPTGHWEVAATRWGAPIEESSTQKAERLMQRYPLIVADSRQGLGSFVFLWGNKQERTPTWYGMFLESGEATAAVDAMQYLWRGQWPGNRSPSISALRIDGREAQTSLIVRHGQMLEAQVDCADPDNDPLQYDWLLRKESRTTAVGGDAESLPAQVPVEMRMDERGNARFRAPSRMGDYRLFVTVRDGQGHAAHANFPFRVGSAN